MNPFTIDSTFSNTLAPQTIRFTAAEDSLNLEIEIVIPASDFSELPEIGSKYKGDIANVYGINQLALTGTEMTALGGDDEYFRCRLTYGPSPLYDESSSGVRKVYELTTEDMDVPLAQHEDYRMKWNHVLLAKSGKGMPSFWSDAKDSSGSGSDYQWAKPGDAVSDGWVVIAAETKPGVESFRSGVPMVIKTETALSRTSLQNEAKHNDYTKDTPGITFGFGGQWLRCGSSIRRNGRWWELQVRYINCKKVDSDLYDT
jgi:hypothetical protein